MNIEDLKVAILPLAIEWGNKDKNFETVAAAMATIESDTDVVVLPELFTTAFLPDKDMMADVAEPLSGRTLEFVRDMAKRYNVGIAGSFLAGIGGLYYNRGFFVEPSGDETIYDKKHLFSLSRESKIMAGGSKRPPVVRFRGWNLALIVCYDLRFPVWCRNHALAYDAMLVPANWPVARKYAWEHLLMGRAIENQAYYVGADRAGTDDYGDYDGMAMIVDYEGKPIGETRGNFVYATLERGKIETSRQRFAAWRDADEFNFL